MLHVGIVGCSAEGAALCYRTFCLEGERFLTRRRCRRAASSGAVRPPPRATSCST